MCIQNGENSHGGHLRRGLHIESAGIGASHLHGRSNHSRELTLGQFLSGIAGQHHLTVPRGNECGELRNLACERFRFHSTGHEHLEIGLHALLASLVEFHDDGRRHLLQLAVLHIHQDRTVLVEFGLMEASFNIISDIELQLLHGTCGHRRGADNLHLILKTV